MAIVCNSSFVNSLPFSEKVELERAEEEETNCLKTWLFSVAGNVCVCHHGRQKQQRWSGISTMRLANLSTRLVVNLIMLPLLYVCSSGRQESKNTF